MSISYEIPGAVRRFSRRVGDGWTPEQKGVIDSAKSLILIRRVVAEQIIRRPFDNSVIGTIPAAEYELVKCVINPHGVRTDADLDVEEFKRINHAELRIVESTP